MSEPDAAVAKLSDPEINRLLLESAGVILHRPDGSVRWAPDAEDVCDLLGLAVELIDDWCGQTKNAATFRARTAQLLGARAADLGRLVSRSR